MYKAHITLGVAPTKRERLPIGPALEQKNRLMAVISKIKPENITLVTLDELCPDGIFCRPDEVPSIVERFRLAGIDGLFIPFMDFGEEGAVLELYKAFQGIPLLIWGGRDEAPNTYEKRGRDCQCGMLAATRILRRMGATYSYIHSCFAEDDDFAKGYETFARAVNVVREITHLKLARIGNRPQPFVSVMGNESALIEKFGMVTENIPVFHITQRAEKIMEEDGGEYQAYLHDLQSRYDMSAITPTEQRKVAAIKIATQQILQEHGCQAAAMQCWPVFVELIGIRPCLTLGEMSAERIPIACECDLNGAVTLVMLRACALGENLTFFADVTVRHPENDNAGLLWHCGQFPYQLKDPDSKARIVEGRQVFKLCGSDAVTVARFEECRGEYYLFCGQGKTTDGPDTTCTYTWIEVEHWRQWEEKLIFGPYIHHVGCVYGSYSDALREASRYLGLRFDRPEDGEVRSL